MLVDAARAAVRRLEREATLEGHRPRGGPDTEQAVRLIGGDDELAFKPPPEKMVGLGEGRAHAYGTGRDLPGCGDNLPEPAGEIFHPCDEGKDLRHRPVDLHARSRLNHPW